MNLRSTTVDLRPDHLATVNAILIAEVPDYEVWAFGSRANWTAKDSSDLDLAIASKAPVPVKRLRRLQRAFEESYLPLKVDVVDLSKASPEFRGLIEKQHVVLRKPETDGAAKHSTDREWRSLPLEESVETIIDYRGKTPKKVTQGIPLITARIIKGGRIETPEEFISPDDYEGWMRRGIPRAGDVLLTTEAPLGEVAQLDERKVALAQRVVALRGKKGLLENDFLKYLLQSSQVQDQLKSRASGTTVQGIKQSELRKISLAIPPLDQQRAIAQVLGSLDNEIESNRRMNETLKAIGRALFESWFVNFDPVRAKAEGRLTKREICSNYNLSAPAFEAFPARLEDSDLGEIPVGWSVAPLHEIAYVTMGLSPIGESYNTGGLGIPLINGPVEFGEEFPVKTKWTTSPTRMAQVGDLIFCVRGSTTGRRVVADDAYCLGRGVCAIRAKSNARTFLYQTISVGLDRLLSKTTGSVFPSLSAPDIKGFLILVPPQNIVEAFARIVEPLTNRVEANIRESRTLAALRDVLLPKLMSDQLRVGDAQRIIGGHV